MQIQIIDLNMERNYNAALQNFVAILRTKSTEFNESITELNRIVVRIENLSPKLSVLENIEYVFSYLFLIYRSDNETKGEIFAERMTSSCIRWKWL